MSLKIQQNPNVQLAIVCHLLRSWPLGGRRSDVSEFSKPFLVKTQAHVSENGSSNGFSV